ncbi:zinc-binding dehydrogenase [uncultured Brevibacillus sp.]|uniref:zinc-binding dehydrogenase n=1 Tax=uncultured Brevibacillus sp. TaxID=169970 RepID=UPI00259A1BC1|nr:zinc-binding dehydrogenase [uncultured Brevibacillus sp.]
MKAIIHTKHSGLEGLCYGDIHDKAPGFGKVKVKLKVAGLNHRDLFLMDGRKGDMAPLIIGSDGAGTIAAIGEGVSHLSVGTEVILNPSIGWERTDEIPAALEILGGPSDGTFAEYVIVPADNVFNKPAYLTWEEAGVLPLSALTAYRALFTRGNLKQGQHVLIPGIGGGVATFAMLMALAVGATVSVTSRSEAKRQAALSYGAHRALESHGDWVTSLGANNVDLILDSIGPATFPQYFDVIKPNGRIVTFGASSGDRIELPIRAIFFPQIQIIGTSMGSREEFSEMLSFMERHSLHPVIDHVYPLQDSVQAFQRMKRGEQLGNIGLRIG